MDGESRLRKKGSESKAASPWLGKLKYYAHAGILFLIIGWEVLVISRMRLPLMDGSDRFGPREYRGMPGAH